MENKVLSGVKIEQELPNVYLEHLDVLGSGKETLTEGHAFDKMDRKIQLFVKTEQTKVKPEYTEINSSSRSYPCITKQEHSEIGIFHAIDLKLIKQEISHTLCKDKSHGFSKALDLISSNNFPELTGNCTVEPETSESGCKVSFQMKNYNQMFENEYSMVEIIETSSLTNRDLQDHNRETVVKQEQFSGWSRDFTVDICSTDPHKTQNISDGCDANVGMNLGGVENSYKVHTCKAFTKVFLDKPYKCDVCSASFTQLGNLKHHKRTTRTGNQPYRCDVCDASFAKSNHLKIHKRTHTGEKPFKCDVCGASFTQLCNLNCHKRTHTGEKPYKCDECEASFTQSGSLNCHKRTHTGEKPYKCDVCDASFAQSFGLNCHKITHTGERPYKCDVCGASFTKSGDLNIHKRKHTGENPYKCDLCGASFTKSGDLNIHKRKHTGENPYKCDLCGASFTQLGSLNQHKRTHTGEKPYKCDVCGASFNKSGNLKCHKRVHTGEKPYKCDVCGASFTASSHLKRHKRTHTRE